VAADTIFILALVSLNTEVSKFFITGRSMIPVQGHISRDITVMEVLR